MAQEFIDPEFARGMQFSSSTFAPAQPAPSPVNAGAAFTPEFSDAPVPVDTRRWLVSVGVAGAARANQVRQARFLSALMAAGPAQTAAQPPVQGVDQGRSITLEQAAQIQRTMGMTQGRGMGIQ